MPSISHRLCAQCGALFHPRSRGGLYCSRACAGAAIRKFPDKSCSRCGAIFRPVRASSMFCSKTCADTARRQHIVHECRCEECGAVFLSDQSRRNRFCCMSCYRSNQARAKMVFNRECRFCKVGFVTVRSDQIFCTSKCATDYDRRQGSVTVYCDGCGGLVTKYKSTVAAADFTFCCAECRAEWRGRKVSVTCRGCEVIFRVHPGKGSMRQFCSQKCYSVWLHTRTASDLECRVGDALRVRGMSLQPQYPLQGFSYDFADVAAGVLIEVDGTYWHSLPGAKNRDRAKDIVAYRSGWRLIRIPEADLAANWDGTLDRALSGELDVRKPNS